MPYRGSLTGCINQLGIMWRQTPNVMLSIISHPRAKYYSTVTDAELASPEYKPETGDVRLVFRGTIGELRALMKAPQLDMDIGLPKDAQPSDN